MKRDAEVASSLEDRIRRTDDLLYKEISNPGGYTATQVYLYGYRDGLLKKSCEELEEEFWREDGFWEVYEMGLADGQGDLAEFSQDAKSNS